MPTRRSFLGHSTTAALGLPLLASAAADAHGTVKTGALPALPDISFATREPFLHRERAQAVLTAEGLDAVVVGEGRNLFYATNFFPLMERMSLMATTLAVIPRDLRKPVALVIPSFSYYYIQSDDGLVPGVQPFVFTGPAGYTDSRRTEDEPPAADPRLYRLDGEASAREQRRRAAVEAAAPYPSSMERALALALAELGIKGGRIGYDHGSIPPLLARALPGATAVSAEDTLRRVRLVRTAPEIRMMRLAAQANVDAALATVRATREVGTLRALRQRYYAEVAARGNLGVFMVINGVSSEAYDEPLREGQSFLIDCVSHLRNFHGDYGRTVCVGEPTARMKACTDAMGRAWGELQPLLRPGLRFSEVRSLGNDILRRMGTDVPISFGPHSVGLAHNDQPRAAPDGSRQDLVIERDMILSIDCPLFETGRGGTGHLEDLVRITDSGAEPIHTVQPAALIA